MGIGRLSDGLAPTPPMGWNSWNRFGPKIDETLVLETAEAMVTSGMRDAGYRYLVIDDGWMAPERNEEVGGSDSRARAPLRHLHRRGHEDLSRPTGQPRLRVPGCAPFRRVGCRLRQGRLVPHGGHGSAR